MRYWCLRGLAMPDFAGSWNTQDQLRRYARTISQLLDGLGSHALPERVHRTTASTARSTAGQPVSWRNQQARAHALVCWREEVTLSNGCGDVVISPSNL